jgi:HD-like signal output (HDOD) protein
MANESVLARIARDPHLPTPSPVALRVLEKASRPECSLADISGLISHDPALCAKILKIVNSAFFAVPRKVTAINRALSLLGVSHVRS